MKNSIEKVSFPNIGPCVVCGRRITLEMWDDGLQGRFCSDCFDYVVDAEGILVSQGLAPVKSIEAPPLVAFQLHSRMARLNVAADTAHSAGPSPASNVIKAGVLSPRPKQATDIVTLGESDLIVTRMGIGIGGCAWNRFGQEEAKGGVTEFADLIEFAFDRGLRFWDLDNQFGTHPNLRRALKRVPREEITILAKTTATNAKDVCSDIERYRRELGTEYIDLLILHCLTDADWPCAMRSAMDAIAEAKARGIVRSHGVACSTLAALRAAAKEPWVEVGMARINPAGVLMDSDPDTVLSVLHQMKQAGKGIIAGKIFGAGRLADRIDECLRFVLGQYCVDSFSIGIETKEQLDEVLRLIPLNSP